MRSTVVTVAVALLLAGVAAGIGRWERDHWADEQRAGLRHVWDAVGGLHRTLPDNFRLPTLRPPTSKQLSLGCFTWPDWPYAQAYELCFDEASGALVEAVDRHGGERRWTLIPEVDAADISVLTAEARAVRARLERISRLRMKHVQEMLRLGLVE